jgi:hypothetical protein
VYIGNNNNVAVGKGALENGTCSNNVAVGYTAGSNITSGSDNICIGVSAGVNLTTGSGCIYIGRTATAYSSSVQREIVIGINNVDGTPLIGKGSNTTLIAGPLYVSNLGSGTVYSNNGALTNTAPSDPSLKTNIVPLSVTVDQLNPVQFNWIDTKKYSPKLQFGFLANEVQAIFPNIVSTWIDDDGSQKLGYDPMLLIPVLTSSIKQQNAKIASLEAQIAALAAQVQGLLNK